MSVEEDVSHHFPKVYIRWLHTLKRFRDAGLATACQQEDETIWVESTNDGWKLGASLFNDEQGVTFGVDLTSGERGEHHSRIGFSVEPGADDEVLAWSLDVCLTDPTHSEIVSMSLNERHTSQPDSDLSWFERLTERMSGRPIEHRTIDVSGEEAQQVITEFIRIFTDAPRPFREHYH